MPRVLLTWNGKPGAQKVALTKLLKEQPGLSLSKAKALTDACLRKETVTLDISDKEKAADLVQEIEKLGFVAQVAKEPDG